ncbi:MAG: hypothetical protein ACXIVE_06755, partial [Salinarimonas sp.]
HLVREFLGQFVRDMAHRFLLLRKPSQSHKRIRRGFALRIVNGGRGARGCEVFSHMACSLKLLFQRR